MKKNYAVFIIFLLAACKGGWTSQDQAYWDRNCRDTGGSSGSCNWQMTKTNDAAKKCSDGWWTSGDCLNKQDPNQGGGPSPNPPAPPALPPHEVVNEACDGCPGGLGGFNPEMDTGTNPPKNEGGVFKGTGEVLTHWGNEIGKGWDGVKNELNGNNAERRRKKREAKRLLDEMHDLWQQSEALDTAVSGDVGLIQGSWGVLSDSWQEFGIASRAKNLEEFRGRYNSKTQGILKDVPVADPSVFDGLGKGRGEGIYPEHQKIDNGRKYLEYARGKLDPNGADYAVRKTLVEFGDAALDEAESSYRAGNVVQGNAWNEIGIASADAALSMTPGVGWAKDVYESISGKSLLTGKELTKFEHTMAIAGALTGGIAKLGAIASAGKMIGMMAGVVKTTQEAEKITQAGKEAVEVVEAAAKTGAKTADDVKDLMVMSQGVDETGNVAKGIDKVNSGKDATDISARGPRYSPGIATSSKELYNSEKMMRGTQGNAGLIPKEVAAKLEGKTFSNFDQFREKFWVAVSETKYANEFSQQNKTLMAGGNAPFAAKNQSIGERGLYELHHITPIRVGGSVYDMSNLAIMTPRFHKEVLDRVYHYGK